MSAVFDKLFFDIERHPWVEPRVMCAAHGEGNKKDLLYHVSVGRIKKRNGDLAGFVIAALNR